MILDFGKSAHMQFVTLRSFSETLCEITNVFFSGDKIWEAAVFFFTILYMLLFSWFVLLFIAYGKSALFIIQECIHYSIFGTFLLFLFFHHYFFTDTIFFHSHCAPFISLLIYFNVFIFLCLPHYRLWIGLLYQVRDLEHVQYVSMFVLGRLW